MNSKKLKRKKENWGIEDSYWPFKIYLGPAGEQDLAHSQTLTPGERVEWLMMMQNLLIAHFGKKKTSKK